MKFDEHFLSWVFIYTFSIWLSDIIFGYLTTTSDFWVILGTGFIITCIGTTIYSFLYKSKFKLNASFLLWIFINSLIFFIIKFSFKLIGITNISLFYFLGGLIFHLLAYFIKYGILKNLNLGTKTKIFISIIFFCFFFIFYNGFSNVTTNLFDTETNFSKVSNQIRDSIKSDLDPDSFENLQTAFGRLNELRSENGASALIWNSNIYELTKFQASKKLCSISHCDHMDNSGKYFDDYAASYGVSLLGVSGENIASSSCYEAVDNLWLHSTMGHREIMLDPKMHKGALAYDEGNCVLIVTS